MRRSGLSPRSHLAGRWGGVLNQGRRHFLTSAGSVQRLSVCSHGVFGCGLHGFITWKSLPRSS